jgi:hypothetical protein
MRFRLGANFAVLLLSSLTAWASPVDTHYCKSGEKACSYKEAYDFIGWDELTPIQTTLLEPYLRELDPSGPVPPDYKAMFKQWTEDADDKAAEFLAMSRALNHLRIRLGDQNGQPQWIRADQLVTEITQMEGDRMYCHLNVPLFEEWRGNGSNFLLDVEGGKTEKGHFKFDRGDLGGSLHEGFTVQGYTSIRHKARIQINYRSADNLADIDMDVPPWILGFIPNPYHLTYAGSDTRQWLKDYVSRYGPPGFKARKRKATDQ